MKQYLSIPEFAEESGFCEKTIRRRIEEKKLPASKPAGTNRWKIHVRYLPSFMSGWEPAGDTRLQKKIKISV